MSVVSAMLTAMTVGAAGIGAIIVAWISASSATSHGFSASGGADTGADGDVETVGEQVVVQCVGAAGVLATAATSALLLAKRVAKHEGQYSLHEEQTTRVEGGGKLVVAPARAVAVSELVLHG